MTPTFVLIHSPVGGPMTWAAVEEELNSRKGRTIRPILGSMWNGAPPYWSWMADKVVESVGQANDLVLVGHSGSGARLHPTIQRLLGRVTGAVYADCQLPGLLNTARRQAGQAERIRRARHGRVTGAPEREEARAMLAGWPKADQFLREMHEHWPIEFVSEGVPADGWPSVPSAYLRLSSGYPESTAYAEDHGWPLARPDRDNHLLMLLEPGLVAGELVRLAGQLTALRQPSRAAPRASRPLSEDG